MSASSVGRKSQGRIDWIKLKGEFMEQVEILTVVDFLRKKYWKRKWEEMRGQTMVQKKTAWWTEEKKQMKEKALAEAIKRAQAEAIKKASRDIVKVMQTNKLANELALAALMHEQRLVFKKMPDGSVEITRAPNMKTVEKAWKISRVELGKPESIITEAPVEADEPLTQEEEADLERVLRENGIDPEEEPTK